MNDRLWQDGYWQSADGLRLHYRDYPGDAARAAVLCIPGLTRNARDFAAVAERLAGGRRVIVVELRGRGESQWSPDCESYNPGVYIKDVVALLEVLGLPRFVVFGTSLGGIIAMLMGTVGRPGMAGVLLNDIGPVVEEAGLDRIRGYIADAPRWPSWEAYAEATAAIHGHAFPTFGAADWRAMAERLAKEEDGTIVGDYDPAIAIPVARPTPVPAEPWRLIEGFREMPALLVVGALSDIISPATAQEMARRLPLLDVVTIPDVGHPPLLTEPAAEAAIDRLLARADAQA